MNILFVFIRVCKQIIHDKRTLMLIIVMPFLMISIYYFLLKDDLQTALKIGISFETSSNFSESIIDTFKNAESVELVIVNFDDTDNAVKTEHLDALIIFPDSFTQSIAGKGSPVYRLELEGTKPGVKKNLEKLVQAAASKAFLEVSPLGKKLTAVNSIEADVSYTYPLKNFRFIDLVSPAFVAFFMYFISFLLTCVSFLRERSSGTLERIESTALSATSLILGYMLAFFVMGFIQGILLLSFMTWILGIKTAVSLGFALLPILVTVLIGVSMGIFFSTLAENEFQVIQFIPVVIIPQMLLSGLLFEIKSMPVFFQYLAHALPLTYTNNLLKDVLLKALPFTKSISDLLALAGFFVFFTLLSIISIRKRH